MQYDPVAIQPFREELTRIGFRELRSVKDVDETIAKGKGTNLIVINSVCGCAAGKARPGIAMALKRSPVAPDELTTVFAGETSKPPPAMPSWKRWTAVANVPCSSLTISTTSLPPSTTRNRSTASVPS